MKRTNWHAFSYRVSLSAPSRGSTPRADEPGKLVSPAYSKFLGEPNVLPRPLLLVRALAHFGNLDPLASRWVKRDRPRQTISPILPRRKQPWQRPIHLPNRACVGVLVVRRAIVDVGRIE